MFGAKSHKMALLALVLVATAAFGAPARAQSTVTPDAGDIPSYGAAPDTNPEMFEKEGAKHRKGNPGPCPLLGVLYETSRLVELTAPEERYANVGFTGEINGVHGLCAYDGAKPIEMNLDIDMAFGRGPKAGGDSHTYRYWVAVTRTNVGPLAKQYFDVPVHFDKGQLRVAHKETIKKIVIPRANDRISGAAFEILVGFDLTPDQLAFNRAGKRFKVGAVNGGG